jgi:hypothetical protein
MIHAIRTFVGGRELEPRPLPPTVPWIRMVESETAAAH